MAVTQAPVQPNHQLIPELPELVHRCRPAPTCTIRSSHPLARRLIHDALTSDAALSTSVKLHLDGGKPQRGSNQQILILDTCSVEDWAACLSAWQADGGATITLISSEAYGGELELQLLYLGASGVLTFDNLVTNLPKAVHTVAEERFWIRREVLNLYVKRTSGILRKASTCDHRLTARENQIVELLRRKVSNRTIAQKLSISERTAKFHISNILRKLNLASRRELQSLNPLSFPFCPDWLLPQANRGSADVFVIAPAATKETVQRKSPG